MSVDLYGFTTDTGRLLPFFKVGHTKSQLQANFGTSGTLWRYLPASPPLYAEPFLSDMRMIAEASWRHEDNVVAYIGSTVGEHLYMLGDEPVPYNPTIGNKVDVSAGGYEFRNWGEFEGMEKVGYITGSWSGSGTRPVRRTTPVPRIEDHFYNLDSLGGTPRFPAAVLLTSDGFLMRATTYATASNVPGLGAVLRQLSIQVDNGPLGGVDRGYDRVFIRTLGEPGDGPMERFNPRAETNTVGLYPLTKQQMQDFRNDLWSNDFAEGFFTVFTGTGEGAVLASNWFPGLRYALEQSDTDCYITVGNLPLQFSSSKVVTRPLLKEFALISLGSVAVPAEAGNFMDYTEASYRANIPFVGLIDLDPSDVVGRNVWLTYMVNFSDGSCVAYLSHENILAAPTLESVFFSTSAEWGYSVPLSGEKVDTPWAFVFSKLAGVGGNDGGERSVGTLSPNAAYMGDLHAKIIAYRKEDLTAEEYPTATGLPSRRVVTLGNLEGFVQVRNILNTGTTVPVRHADAIIALLQEGVYL